MTPNGIAIRALRKALKVSLRAFAQKTGLSRSYLSRVERGQAGASDATVELIAEALGVPVDAITTQPPRGEDVTVKATPQTPPESEAELTRYSPEEVVEKKLLPYKSPAIVRRKCHRRELHHHNDSGRITFTAEDIRKNSDMFAVVPLIDGKPPKSAA